MGTVGVLEEKALSSCLEISAEYACHTPFSSCHSQTSGKSHGWRWRRWREGVGGEGRKKRKRSRCDERQKREYEDGKGGRRGGKKGMG